MNNTAVCAGMSMNYLRQTHPSFDSARTQCHVTQQEHLELERISLCLGCYSLHFDTRTRTRTAVIFIDSTCVT